MFSPVPNQLREFTERDLARMTADFAVVVGRGAFGCVYKGVCDHTPVAVKVIDPVSFRNFVNITGIVTIQKALQNMGESTFKTELNSLTR